VSLFGDWFNLIASAALVAELTGSSFAIGGLFVVRMLAPFLVSPLAGVAADRYDRRNLLVFTDIVRAVVVLGFLLVRTEELVWLLYLLTFVQLGMHGVFFPTRNAFLPDVVASRDLGAANAITSATWSVMLATGAAAGGLVAGGFGVYPAFVIDSLTFVLSAVILLRIKGQRVHRRESGVEARIGAVKSLADGIREYFEGLRYMKRNFDVGVLVLHKAALCLFVAGAFEVIQVAIAKDIFVIGEGGGISLGILYAGIGVGSGLGPIAARALTGDNDERLRRALIVAYLVMSVGLAIISTLESLPVVFLGSLIRAVGGGTLWVFSTQLLLQSVPDRVRGRVFGTEFALLTLAMATGAGLGGYVLESGELGIGQIVHRMSIFVLVPGALWAAWTLSSRSGSRAHTQPGDPAGNGTKHQRPRPRRPARPGGL
jgi:MFS family permease